MKGRKQTKNGTKTEAKKEEIYKEFLANIKDWTLYNNRREIKEKTIEKKEKKKQGVSVVQW